MPNATRSTYSQTAETQRTSTTSNAAETLDRSSHWSEVVQRVHAAPQMLTTQDMLTLQRAIGNRATVGLISRSTGVQAKLKLGPAGDKYEQEADRVADQVTRQMERPQPVQRVGEEEELAQAKPLAYGSGNLQRKQELRSKMIFTKPDRGAVAQAKPLAATISRVQRAPKAQFTKERFVQRQEEEEELTQMKPLHGAEGGEVESSVAQQIGAARGGGQPLDEGVRSKMEQGFGADFSGVRVHTGGQADTLNRSLNARAFTVGNDVFFDKGQYNPGSSGGQKLIAHELTHTVQQGAVAHRPGRVQAKRAGESSNGQSIVQRGFWDKLKQSKLSKKYQSLKQKLTGKEEEKNEVEDSGNVLRASIALTTSTDVRSEGDREENGHAWIEVEPLVPWPQIEETGLPNKMSEAAKTGLSTSQWHTVGFYPNGDKSIFSRPGKIQEPEKPRMTQNMTASKSFELNETQAGKLFDYVNSKRTAKYNFIRYNCTNFAVGALGAAGFEANEFLGQVTSKRVVSPNKVYKRLFERAVLGDKSVKIAKTLMGKEKHIGDPEAKALERARGGGDDWLNETSDIDEVSQEVKNLSYFLHRNPGRKVRDLWSQHWSLFQKMSPYEKRNLEASFPQVFDEKIDDVLKAKARKEPTPEKMLTTDFVDQPEDLNFFEDNEEKVHSTDFFDPSQELNFFNDNNDNNEEGVILLDDFGEGQEPNFFNDIEEKNEDN